MTNFFSETLQEFKKITWPNREMTMGHTAIVVVVCVVIGYYLGLFDGIFARLLALLVN